MNQRRGIYPLNFLKKLFSKRDEKAIEEQIEKQYIFVELDLEHWYEPFYAQNLTSKSSISIKKEDDPALYEKLLTGRSISPTVAVDTSIEFFIQSDHFDADDIVKVGIVIRHVCSTFDAILMEAVFWKRDDSVESIPFQLNVSQDDEQSRLASALISIQKEIPFYFGRVENGEFTIIKQLVAQMPELVQNDMQITLVELYNDEMRKAGPFVELQSIADREMTTAGWVFHFDDEKLKEEDLDLSLIKVNMLRTIFDKINRLSDKGRFTGWIAENVGDRDGSGPYGETTTFILTATESLHMNGKLHAEVLHYLKSLHGFIREDGGYPLKYEALPIFRQEEGGYGFGAIDEDFLAKADRLSRKMTNKEVNLYNKLLNMKAAT